MPEDIHRSHEPHSRLTNLCNTMIETLASQPDVDDVKAIIMLDDGKRGGIVLHGYGDDDAAGLADLFVHISAIFEANGKKLILAPLQGSPKEN